MKTRKTKNSDVETNPTGSIHLCKDRSTGFWVSSIPDISCPWSVANKMADKKMESYSVTISPFNDITSISKVELVSLSSWEQPSLQVWLCPVSLSSWEQPSLQAWLCTFNTGAMNSSHRWKEQLTAAKQDYYISQWDWSDFDEFVWLSGCAFGMILKQYWE